MHTARSWDKASWIRIAYLIFVMNLDFDKIVSEANRFLEAAGFLFRVEVVGKEGPRSLLMGGRVVLSPLPDGQWGLTAFNAHLFLIRFGVAEAEDAKARLLPKCASLNDALVAAAEWLAHLGVTEFQRGFNEAFPKDGVSLVRSIPENAVQIVDGDATFRKALALYENPSVTDCLPKGALRWLGNRDWSKAKTVFNLKGTYRASIERHGRPDTYYADWILTDAHLAEPYDRAKKIDVLPYSRGVALPSDYYQDGYDVFFVVPHEKHPYVRCFRVRKNQFAKNFAWSLADDLTTEVTIEGYSKDWYFGRPTTRRVPIQKLFQADPNKAPLFLLGKNLRDVLSEHESVSLRVRVAPTGVNQRLNFLICKVKDEELFFNYSAGNSFLDEEISNLEFRTFDGQPRNVAVSIETRKSGDKYFTSVEEKLQPFFGFAKIYIPDKAKQAKFDALAAKMI